MTFGFIGLGILVRENQVSTVSETKTRVGNKVVVTSLYQITSVETDRVRFRERKQEVE